MTDSFATHEVFNQPPVLEDYDPVATDATLTESLKRWNADWAMEDINRLGRRTGSQEVAEWTDQANRYTPELHTHDRFGHRIDEVRFHPAYHALMDLAISHGVHNYAWVHEGRAGAQLARLALSYLFYQGEQGVGCPVAMTFAGIPALERQPEIAAEWKPRLLSDTYDRRFIPASEKRGATMGMAMTEKQGGSDVRANSTRATPIGRGGPGGEYLLRGHKWFCSAPMSDMFLTLAYTDDGLSCFMAPRFRPDGSRNNIRIQRLKEKLGNRSNASSEIEYADCWARMVGEEGRGVPTIIEMVHNTRLECAMGSAALMRKSTVLAMHHASHRSAFQKRLIDQPLMQTVLADLALESEAATLLVMRLGHAFDMAANSREERAFARIATAIGKYWTCKRCPTVLAEALECHGGSGYVEEGPMARLYREAPLNGIWEGSGNVICLDVLRAMYKTPETIDILMAELNEARGSNHLYDQHLNNLADMLARGSGEITARRMVETMALLLQAGLLLRFSPAAISDAFIASRLGGDWGYALGTLPPQSDFATILSRSWPQD